MLLYFKRYWEETTAEPITDEWGFSTYYFETESDGEVTRQIQLFDNGRMLKYSTSEPEDEFGSIADQPLDLEEFAAYATDQVEFEQIWSS